MCDTQVIRQGSTTYFAKNSDREAGEPQFVVRVPPVRGDKTAMLRTTYIDVPQTADRFAMILSKPSWIWGAEMGVNERGVAIGNEAVFTRLVAKKGEFLLGMDLLRLALERSDSADEAVQVITSLLREHGQGGCAGYRDKSFRYDNSFLIASPGQAWVLETAGRWWVAKRVDRYAALSNCLSIGSDYDLSSSGLEDFARRDGYFSGSGEFNFARAFDTRFMPLMGEAAKRRRLSLCELEEIDSASSERSANAASLESMAKILRRHARSDSDFAKHGNRDVCLHAGGLTRPSQTCGSIVARLDRQGSVGEDEGGQRGQRGQVDTRVMMTGTSAPCFSLFRPLDFNFERRLTSEHKDGVADDDSLWSRFELVHRRALQSAEFCDELRSSRDGLEPAMMAALGDESAITRADQEADLWLKQWRDRASNTPAEFSRWQPYGRYWRGQNRRDGLA